MGTSGSVIAGSISIPAGARGYSPGAVRGALQATGFASKRSLNGVRPGLRPGPGGSSLREVGIFLPGYREAGDGALAGALVHPEAALVVLDYRLRFEGAVPGGLEPVIPVVAVLESVRRT